MASLASGAGREVKEAAIDFGAGIYLYKKCGDYVKKGESIARVYASDEVKLNIAVDRLKKAYLLSEEKPKKRPLIFNIVK